MSDREETFGQTEQITEEPEAVLAAAEELREDMRAAQRTRRRTLCGGVVLGMALGMLLTLLFGVVPIVQMTESEPETTETADSESMGLLTPAVEKKLQSLVTMIDAMYYEDVDTEELVNGLYKGLFEGIGDPYSAYYTSDEYETMLISATSTLSGIGAVLQQDPDTMQVTVNYVYEGSPAEKAGIRKGDQLLRVDDITATTMELSELVTHIRGDKGTVVHLRLYRQGMLEYLELDVERDIVDMPTLSGQMLEHQIGYISIAEFGDKTAEEFAEQVEALESQGMTALIVDLRNNPGGVVKSVTQMLDQILPEGVIVSTKDKYGKEETYTSDASCMDIPLAVLINGSSASSSEIFAGAIRDYDYGTLIGTRTFGKGIVQSIRRLKDGSAIKLTTSKYYTPSGENIHGEGIAPDIELEYEYLGPTDEDYDIKYDNQIQKAIEVLEKERR